jgi:hypothetical protein
MHTSDYTNVSTKKPSDDSERSSEDEFTSTLEKLQDCLLFCQGDLQVLEEETKEPFPARISKNLRT